MKSTLLSVTRSLLVFAAMGLVQETNSYGQTFRESSYTQGEVTESPQGMINGVNSAFSLTSTPDPQQAFYLFRDGLLLNSGTDYVVSGQTLTFMPSRTPVVGDVLEVIYHPSATIRAASQGSAANNILAATRSDEIAMAAAAEQLKAEIKSVLDNQNASAMGSVPEGTGTHLRDASDPLSLRMLFEHSHRRAGTSRDEDLQGLEGLGDGLDFSGAQQTFSDSYQNELDNAYIPNKPAPDREMELPFSSIPSIDMAEHSAKKQDREVSNPNGSSENSGREHTGQHASSIPAIQMLQRNLQRADSEHAVADEPSKKHNKRDWQRVNDR